MTFDGDAAATRRVRLVLASASPARLQTLRSAGLEPEVVVSGVDETSVEAGTAAGVASELAHRKATAVAADLRDVVQGSVLVVGCDSVLELDGETHGKPESAQDAVRRWHRMRGSRGLLHTGHCVVNGATGRAETATETTVVQFADVTDEEIDAYVGTGEPLRVAGAFTLDGLGGAFVRRIEGDPHNVVGISLPLLREMLARLGVSWTDLWAR